MWKWVILGALLVGLGYAATASGNAGDAVGNGLVAFFLPGLPLSALVIWGLSRVFGRA